MPRPSVPPPPLRPVARGFHRYVCRLAARHFAAVHWGAASGEIPAAGPDGEGPGHATAVPGPQSTLFVANHSNWWDGFLAYLVGAGLGLHFQVLMEAKNLDRYWMFRWVGALPLHRGQPARGYADLARAAVTLARPATGLWVFPQGDRRPPAEPVRGCQTGAAHLALSVPGPIRIWPVAFRYAYRGEQIPEAFAWLGKPWARDPGPAPGSRDARRELTQQIEDRLRETVAALDARLAGEQLGEFALLLPGRLSINKRLDRVRHLFGLLDGPFERRNG